MAQIKTLNGFRDFALVESSELYLKKSGGEIAGQLFRFEDQGGRDISIRPEVTPSLARLVAARQREFQKPMKWFQMGQCFRYERPQKGRLREFYQYNVDLIGEDSLEADVELIALSIEVMRELGFKAGDFVVRLSHRSAWKEFCKDLINNNGLREGEEEIVDEELELFNEVVSLVDKWEKLSENKIEEELKAFNYPVTYQQIKEFIDSPDVSELNEIVVKVDLTIIRGLAYYTGTVFEVFDLKNDMRAVAGGGRYDDLIKTLSDGAIDLPVIGFGMGDVVLRNLIEETPQALIKMEAALRAKSVCDVFCIIVEEDQRGKAGQLVTELRQAGIKTDYSLTKQKMGKQFQKAEQLRARFAIVVGSEFPTVQVKNLNERTEEVLEYGENFIEKLQNKLDDFDAGMLA